MTLEQLQEEVVMLRQKLSEATQQYRVLIRESVHDKAHLLHFKIIELEKELVLKSKIYEDLILQKLTAETLLNNLPEDGKNKNNHLFSN